MDIYKTHQMTVRERDLKEKLLKYYQGKRTESWDTEVRKSKGLMTESDIQSSIECSLCLNEFKEGMQVVQLECHRNHVFHHQCFQTLVQENT